MSSYFKNALKILVVNNFVAASSPGSNCEVDDCVGALNSLRDFLMVGEEEIENNVQPITDEFKVDASFVQQIPKKFKFKRAKNRRLFLYAYLAG